MNIRNYRFTTLTDDQIDDFAATFLYDAYGPKGWRFDVYEEILTHENSDMRIVAKNNDTPLEYAFGECKISNDGTAVQLNGKTVYGCMVVHSNKPGISKLEVNGRIRFRTPWPYAGNLCIGTIVRTWCGARHTSGQYLVPNTSTDLIAPESKNGDYKFKADVKYSNIYQPMVFQPKPAHVMFMHAGANYGKKNSEYVYIPFTASVSHPGTCIFVSISLLYKWCPGILGSNTICWTLPSPIPLVMSKATGNTLSLPVRVPDDNEFGDELSSLKTAAKTILLDGNGDYRTDTLQALNGGDAAHAETYTATFDRSLFNDYPNSASIFGVAQLWTYLPQVVSPYYGGRTVYNIDNLPAENGFELRLPENADTRPVAGTITYSVVKGGFGLNTYVQNHTGVKIKMAQPTCKLSATPAAMVIDYYGGTARIETQDSDGGFTFTLPVLTVNGQTQFTVYAEDSRGFRSVGASKTITVYPYAPPGMAEYTLCRVDGEGNQTDFGDQAALTITPSWSSVNNLNSITSIKAAILQYEPHMDWQHAVDRAVTAGTPYRFPITLDPARLYRVRIKITDKGGITTTYYRTVRTAAYTLHLRQSGNGIGMGEASRHEHSLSVAENWAVVAYDRNLMDMLVPIGTVQLIDRTDGEVADMSALYPGTVWERITDRYFLATGDSVQAGDTGGSETVTLAAGNIPQIPVTFANGIYGPRSRFAGPINAIPGVGGVTVPNEKGGFKQWSGPNFLNGSYANKGNEPKPVTTVPPYLAVDAWIRIR